MTNADVAAFLRELGAIVEARGDSIFKVRAYTDAAQRFEQMEDSVEALVQEGRLRRLPGVGEAISSKVEELVRTGQSSYLDRYRAELPPGLAELLRIPGLTPGTAGRIYRSLGAQSLEDVRRAAEEHRISRLLRIPAGTEERILAALEAA